MKKVFSLILAVAMVLSLGAVAFAAPATNSKVTPWDTTDTTKKTLPVKEWRGELLYTYASKSHQFTPVGELVGYGKTIYMPLFVSGTNADGTSLAEQEKAVQNLKVDVIVEEGAAYYDSVAIVKMFGKGVATATDNTKTTTDDINAYYVAIKTKGNNTDSKTLAGTIKVEGKTYNDSTSVTIKDDSVHFAVKFGYAETTIKADTTKARTLAEDFKTASKVLYVASATDKNTVDDVEFKDVAGSAEAFKFEVDMYKGEKVIMEYENDVNEALEAANEEAGMEFYNFNGTTFKKSGKATFTVDEEYDNYLYKVNEDGTLAPLNSTYSTDDNAFIFKVKKLGNYVVSDMPLVDATGTVAATVVAYSPVTGAIA